LSAAMREAIAKGAEEGERDAKRAKVEITTSQSILSLYVSSPQVTR
jgi:hypothetical protein